MVSIPQNFVSISGLPGVSVGDPQTAGYINYILGLIGQERVIILNLNTELTELADAILSADSYGSSGPVAIGPVIGNGAPQQAAPSEPLLIGLDQAVKTYYEVIIRGEWTNTTGGPLTGTLFGNIAPTPAPSSPTFFTYSFSVAAGATEEFCIDVKVAKLDEDEILGFCGEIDIDDTPTGGLAVDASIPISTTQNSQIGIFADFDTGLNLGASNIILIATAPKGG